MAESSQDYSITHGAREVFRSDDHEHTIQQRKKWTMLELNRGLLEVFEVGPHRPF
jgi:hypothetical protein